MHTGDYGTIVIIHNICIGYFDESTWAVSLYKREKQNFNETLVYSHIVYLPYILVYKLYFLLNNNKLEHKLGEI